MKVLVLVGHTGEWKKNNLRELARVWQDQHMRPRVEAIGSGTTAFAIEVERSIYERLSRPDGGFVHYVGTAKQPHAQKLSKPEDPDFLEALQHDIVFWGPSGSGEASFAGYHVSPMDSRIVKK